MTLSFDLGRQLDALLRKAAQGLDAFGDDFDPGIRPADPRFGDYQANGVLPYAKQAKVNPRQLATQLVDALLASDDFKGALIQPKKGETPTVPEGVDYALEIAGPGFINFRVAPGVLQQWLKEYRDEASFKAGAASRFNGRKIIVDYPSPNTAKQMHIGHLRPMVIGEAVSRILEFCGADVTRDNHIGDWGTNFGTLIMAIKREGVDLSTLGADALPEIERLYKLGTSLEKEDPAIRDISRNELVKLQQGDAENTAIWEQIVAVSNSAFERNYDRLGVKPDLTLGESFYRDKVDRVYDELIACNIAEESDGALVVWHDEVKKFARDNERPYPFNIRKQDGASNYASTDLATVLYRVEELKADEVIYVTDGRQQDHFEQLFLTVDKWFARKEYPKPQLEHVWFGTILGEDGKAIKTRSGEPIRLNELLDEAAKRAADTAADKMKSPDLTDAEKAAIAEAVGIGAVRYADLSSNRTQDYVFSWEKMLAFEGNTAPYLQMQGARIHGIFRKMGLQPGEGEDGASGLETPEELSLARKLLNLPVALEMAISDLRPHHICTYLFELAGEFSSFYSANHVMVDEADVKARRVMLCARTLAVLETGMHLLGIQTLEKM
ncbi:arginine--tRNA ligase [Cerasicoccus fimbriatus]|uniref:arginine--tRNA ligase n=1 Tax=Cerasicoccus fimbriatus TaxID=3014554 RepID=UPI0022B3AFA3|nr:arginine--tRNA ligase [Cerasicoccus sp. TK19100]